MRRVHRVLAVVHEVIVERVLDVRLRIGAAEDALGVRIVFREEPLVGRVAIEQIRWHLAMRRPEHAHAGRGVGDGDARHHESRRIRVPRPDVLEPEGGQKMQRRGIGAAVAGCDSDQDVVGRGLCIFDEDIEVAVVVEDAGVEQFVFRVGARAAAVRLHQIRIRVGTLRILVQVLHVRVARHVVEVEVALLDVFAVIALGTGEAEHPLLQDRVLAVPQRKREAELLAVVADAGDAVLAPPVGARARVVVRQVIPGVAVRAVVLAHRAPLPFAQVRAPHPPRRLAVARGGQPLFLRGQRRMAGRVLVGRWSVVVRSHELSVRSADRGL